MSPATRLPNVPPRIRRAVKIHGAMRSLVVLSLVAVSGCGRLGQEPASGDARAPDASAIVPSNGVAFPSGVTLGALAIDVDAVISTDDGSIVSADGARVLRPAATGIAAGVWVELRPGLAVFAVDSLTVMRTVALRGTRAAAILVVDRATLAGELRLRGGEPNIADAGPGGSQGGATTSAPAGGCGSGRAGRASDVVITGADSDGGGAGGAYGTAGGGGSVHLDSGAATTPCGAATLEPLIGGSGGGAGGVFQDVRIGGLGGGGGGALQITSATQIEVLGTIDAGGGGGENGRTEPPQGAQDWGGGGGGGAGGAILLEAPAVVVRGTLAANGGGGGADVGTGPAARGTTSASPAPGGDQGPIRGGAGCAGTTMAQAGAAVVGGRDAAGGGGGCGRIRINADAPVTLDGLISPVPSVGPLRR